MLLILPLHAAEDMHVTVAYSAAIGAAARLLALRASW
jgi:hypothetical protein